MTRTRLATVVAGAVAAVVVLALAAGPVSAAPVHLLPYRGLETWVDIYDVSLRADPEAAVAGMRAAGVHTLYFETSSSTAPAAIVAPSVVTRFIAAAHASRMKVVAWYRPELTRPGIHRYRSLQAIAFRTPDGQRFDAFALDIESAAVHNAGLRTRRLLDLSTALRSAAGGAYPLGAIVPAPAGMRLNPGYWPQFPFRALRSRFSVFLPMAYFTYHVTTATAAHDYTASNVALLRARTGDAAVPIHLVGGEAGAAPDDQVAAFVGPHASGACSG